MKTALILHGKPGKEEYYNDEFPSASNSHWLPWLQKQLLIKDIAAHTPEVPGVWTPNYETYCKEFERYDVTPDTILVGHSLGGGFILRWLSEHPEMKVGKVVLVAPSIGVDWDHQGLFDFTIDPNLVSRTQGMVIFGSDNDRPGIIESIKRCRAAIKNIEYREFKGYGHFTLKHLGTVEFPELLEEVLS
jgi:uncharacterized protein